MKLVIGVVMSVVAMSAIQGCQRQAAGRGTAPGPDAAATPASGASQARVDERLTRLEAAYAKHAEALAFLDQVYAQQQQQQQAHERETPAPDAVFAVPVAEAIAAGQVDGPATAAVTIVEAFDFACPYCAQSSPTLDALVKDNAGKVRVVYMNLVVHPPARPAHLASCAAARQGKYKEFKNAFWIKGFEPYAASRDPSKLGEDNLVAIAKGLGLNVAKLKTDMASAACTERVAHDMTQLAAFHVNATPTFFINGKHVGGALPREGFQQIIDQRLEAVVASGVPPAEYYDKVVLGTGEKQFRSKLDPEPN